MTASYNLSQLGSHYNQGGTGAVDRTTASKLQESVSIEDFGAVGNGSADDTAAFNSFNAWAKTSPNTIVLNLADNKTYMVSNPWWPANIKNLVVNGNGCKIQNNATVNVNKSLLNPAYGTNANGAGSYYTPVNRYLISTTAVGDVQITTITPSDAGNFSVGEMILVASFDIQFGGQPPNYRYFDYVVVTGVNASTGVVTLDRPVKYAHQSNFPYVVYANGDGRAHIEKIEQGSLFNITHVYNDITFVPNTVSSGGATSEAVLCTGYYLQFNRCNSTQFIPTVANTAILNDCRHTGTVAEFDKLVTYVELNDNVIASQLTACTSVASLRAKRTKFSAGYNLNPRLLELIDCDVEASAQSGVALFGAYGSVESVTINGGQHEWLPYYTITQTQTITTVINGTTTTWTPSTNTLGLNITGSPENLFIAKCYPGRIIQITAAYLGTETPTGGYGIVRSVTGSSGTASVIVDFSHASLAGTERLTIFDEPNFTNIQTNCSNAQPNFFPLQTSAINQDFIVFPNKKYRIKSVKLTSGYIIQNTPSFGRPTKLTVDVVRAYTGSTSGNVTLQIQSIYPSSSRYNKLIDLKTVGRRECQIIGNAGWTGTSGESTGANLPSGSFESAFFGTMLFYASTMATTADEQLPIVDIEFEFDSPYAR